MMNTTGQTKGTQGSREGQCVMSCDDPGLSHRVARHFSRHGGPQPAHQAAVSLAAQHLPRAVQRRGVGVRRVHGAQLHAALDELRRADDEAQEEAGDGGRGGDCHRRGCVAQQVPGLGKHRIIYSRLQRPAHQRRRQSTVDPSRTLVTYDGSEALPGALVRARLGLQPHFHCRRYGWTRELEAGGGNGGRRPEGRRTGGLGGGPVSNGYPTSMLADPAVAPAT